MDIIHGPGYCNVCHNALLTVNDVKTCIFCEAKKPVSGNASTVEDPGHDAMSGIGAVEQAPAPKVIKSVKQGTVQDALNIMRSLPMPDDIKQFKQIKKIIDLMEKLEPRG